MKNLAEAAPETEESAQGGLGLDVGYICKKLHTSSALDIEDINGARRSNLEHW